MNPATPFRHRVAAIVILSSAFAMFAAVPAATAADSTPPPAAEKTLPSLPLTASFAKDTPGENGGPYAVTLKSTSKTALTVKATIIWSVVSHNRARTIELPPREIAAGGTWKINDLAAEDRVIVTAEGFEKLELTTPPAGK